MVRPPEFGLVANCSSLALRDLARSRSTNVTKSAHIKTSKRLPDTNIIISVTVYGRVQGTRDGTVAQENCNTTPRL
jgi:hypothetical protein